MRKTTAGACGFTFLALLLSGIANAEVSIYVVAGEDGLAGAGAKDSVADVTNALAKKNRLSAARSEKEADVILRLDSRERIKEPAGYTTTTRVEQDRNRAYQNAAPNNEIHYVVHATLQMGTFTTPITGDATIAWRLAASAVAAQVEKWVAENYEQVNAKRHGEGPNRDAGSIPSPAASQNGNRPAPVGSESPAPGRPAPALAASPSVDVSITPGMTQEDVRSAMGEPRKKVTFGERALWSYDGVQVVFEKGKVTDVRF